MSLMEECIVGDAASAEGCEVDPETQGMEVVPYYINSQMQPHAITVEQLQSHSAADLDYHLAESGHAVGSLTVRNIPCYLLIPVILSLRVKLKVLFEPCYRPRPALSPAHR